MADTKVLEAFIVRCAGSTPVPGTTVRGELSVQTRADMAAAAPGLPRQRLTFSYDFQGRRIAKKVENYSVVTSTWSTTTDLRFLYDGWNLLAEKDALAANALLRGYSWGLDLSGSTQGAGGVGGLVWASVGTASYTPAYDGNGNIIAWIDLTTGTKIADNDYDAFGKSISISGANPVPFGFSTKYLDSETSLNYYGIRHYSPNSGRWINRDPIEERGGVNLYGMVGNTPVCKWDYLGLNYLSPECVDLLYKIKSLKLKITENEKRLKSLIGYRDNLEKALNNGTNSIIPIIEGLGADVLDMGLAITPFDVADYASLVKLTLHDAPTGLYAGVGGLATSDYSSASSNLANISINYGLTAMKLGELAPSGVFGATPAAAASNLGVYGAVGVFAIKSYESFGAPIFDDFQRSMLRQEAAGKVSYAMYYINSLNIGLSRLQVAFNARCGCNL
jgi:RHS repeat-associated protein